MPTYLLRSTFLSNTHLFIEMVNKLSCMLWVDSEMQFFSLGFWTHIHFLLLYNHNLFTIRFVTIHVVLISVRSKVTVIQTPAHC